jgi:hypothetical protein
MISTVLVKFNLNWSRRDTKEPWFCLAMQSAVMMHTTLAVSAAYWTVNTQAPDRLVIGEGYRQKGEGMQAIREKLSGHYDGRFVSDEVLNGVTCLANVEVRRIPRPEAENVH